MSSTISFNFVSFFRKYNFHKRKSNSFTRLKKQHTFKEKRSTAMLRFGGRFILGASARSARASGATSLSYFVARAGAARALTVRTQASSSSSFTSQRRRTYQSTRSNETPSFSILLFSLQIKVFFKLYQICRYDEKLRHLKQLAQKWRDRPFHHHIC